MSMSKKMITLKASDGGLFEIDEASALQSQTIGHLIEDDCVKNGVPLANVKSEILGKVIEYCKKHVDDGGDDSLSKEKKEEVKNWDAEFMNNIDQSTIFDLILAASYLNIRSLLDLACQTVADMIASCKSGAEIRDMFDIENDFSPEEEEEIRRENQWAFE